MLPHHPDQIEYFVIGGPTASGKSAFALSLAQWLSSVTGKECEVINADSMQLYEHLPILSAQPSLDALQACPHHFYGFVPLDAQYSVAKWLGLVAAKIKELVAANIIPIVVGGTGMYLQCLLKGIAATPEISKDIRQELEEQVISVGIETLYQELQQVDPEVALKISPRDKQRIIRGLSVFKSTGKSLSFWQKQITESPVAGYQSYTILIQPERAWLYEQCNKRFAVMLKRGVVEEVRVAIEKYGLCPESGAWSVLGVKNLAEVLKGQTTLEMAAESIMRETRRYAKRQTTWFKHQYKADFLVEDIEACLLPKP